MNLILVISTQDFAGLTIKQNLLQSYAWKKTAVLFEKEPVLLLETPSPYHVQMITTSKRSILCEHIDDEIKQKGILCDAIIFPTTHRSQEGVPALTAHSVGNWGEAPLGGIPRQLSVPLPRIMRCAFEQLQKQVRGSTYQAALECTHHGPDLDAPCMFIELGSSEEQWKDIDGGKRVANALMAALASPIPEYEIAFGIGGPHYCPNFVKVMERSNYCFGHICPKWGLPDLNKEMIQQAMKKSGATLVILDWKGVGEHKERIVKLLDEMKIPWKRTDEFR
ncbi:D-aminoacyl-tRNA deacylase [Candidatus Woesearchaeota archaeon]|nr:D-aminoacyl-tRNA deacylase [Candidatus Woesearchaeota archaeon]